jgi:hypothetical protein
MSNTLEGVVLDLTNQFVKFMPKLLAGIVLIGLGWLVGWFVKRFIIRISMILKLERLATRFSRDKISLNNDVRYGFYNFLGNIGFVVVFLVFLDFALNTWGLTALSSLLAGLILFFPRLITALVIFGAGWLISLWTARIILRALRRENIPHPAFIALYARALIILFFAAAALIEFNTAREIVLIAFATVFIALAVIAVVLASIEGRKTVKGTAESGDEK